MNAVALKSHSFVARLGAILAAFVLAFSLVSFTVPARADDAQTMKVWTEFKFAGDTVTISMKEHSTVQGADHKTMCNRYSSGGTSPLGFGTVNKSEITQYEGVEVCEMQATVKIDQFISSDGTAIGFGADDKVHREGSNIVYEGDLSVFSDATSDQFIDYKITFAGGVVSAEGAEVSGNTAKLKLGGKFKVVGNSGSGSSNGGSTNGGSSNGGSNNGGSSGNNQGGATPTATPSITPGSDNNENTVANGAPATATPTPLAVKSSKSSSDNTLLYVIIGVAVVSLVGLGAFLALRSGKKKPPSGMGGQFAYAPQSYGPGSYPQQQYPPQGNYPQQGQYGGYNG